MKPTLNLRSPIKFAKSFSDPIWMNSLEETPIGPVTAVVSQSGLALLAFNHRTDLEPLLAGKTGTPAKAPNDLLEEVLKQVCEYLDGKRKVFDIPLDWRSLDTFQTRVHRLTVEIRFGQVRTYGDIAAELGLKNGSRAVGGAQAGNPIPLFIPCHRVVGTDRTLHGFGAPGGIKTKAWLLELEGHRFLNNKLVPSNQPGLF